MLARAVVRRSVRPPPPPVASGTLPALAQGGVEGRESPSVNSQDGWLHLPKVPREGQIKVQMGEQMKERSEGPGEAGPRPSSPLLPPAPPSAEKARSRFSEGPGDSNPQEPKWEAGGRGSLLFAWRF